MMFVKQVFKDRKSLSKALLLLLAMATAALLGQFFLGEQNRSAPASKPAAPSQAELIALAEKASSPPPLTPEEIEEDARMDDEQVALARQWLESADSRQRVDGAEQLSAYPTPEAEMLLAGALATDPDPAVRSAAAQSLDAFEHPMEKTIFALLAAVEDENEDVQMSAWAALETIASNEESDSARFKKIVTGLKKKLASPRLAAETKQAILEFLKDQAPETR